MRTIVLDDDPTGTQCASDVEVLLTWNLNDLVDVLHENESVYVQTNSRSLNENQAIALAQQIKEQGEQVSNFLNEKILFVLRGDSTLRGHVFAESKVFFNKTSKMIFVPAYPDIGRVTINGEHWLISGDEALPVAETEFAKDPVFSFTTSFLPDYVREKSNLRGVRIDLAILRGEFGNLLKAISNAPTHSVILPDIETNADIDVLKAAINELLAGGEHLVVRCAAPLAASLAGVRSTKYLNGPILVGEFSTALIAGSHTEGSTEQLASIDALFGPSLTISTEIALNDPAQAAKRLIEVCLSKLAEMDFVAITTERIRKSEHSTLEHGDKVMKALVFVAQRIVDNCALIIAKGGITSAEIATHGVGAKKGRVLGQILPGISVWELRTSKFKKILYIVVPGNVGDSSTLVRVLEIAGFKSQS